VGSRTDPSGKERLKMTADSDVVGRYAEEQNGVRKHSCPN
jgi:hypothetical protein